MSETTPSLGLPFIMAAQAQKHVTHNDALLGLDALVQLSVLSRTVADPPGSPQEGDRYLVAATASGDWAGMEGSVAAFQDGVWRHYAPMPGWRAWIADEARLLLFDGSQWRGVLSDEDLQNLALVGINATADATNKLAVKSAAVLFDNIGNDSRVKVNKASAGDTASHLFQTGYSGRAEFGLTGDDDFHAKVSPDGATWYDGLVIDKATGIVTFPSGVGESGTFTPTVTFATPGDFSPTYTIQDGKYLRIGRAVHFAMLIAFDTNAYTTTTGVFQIAGLPFAVMADAGNTYHAVSLCRIYKVTWGGSDKMLNAAVIQNSTLCYLIFSRSASGSAPVATTTNIPPSTTGISLWIAGTYMTN